MRIRRELVGALCALVVTACAAAAAGPDDTPTTTTASPVVDGVGVLPTATAGDPDDVDVTDGETVPADASTTTRPATTTTALHAEGNRVLLLGDSILASTSSRYSNDMCKALVPLGWEVEVEAEVSRGIAFGNEVLASRKKAGWDVGVVFLGSNDGSNSNEYLKALNKIVTTFAPSPVVLITVSEFRDEMRGINSTIRAIAEVYPDQVSVLPWDEITENDPGVLNIDGIHPTPAGRTVLADAVAEHLGPAPSSSPGTCLPSVFTDDSAGSIDGGSTATTVKGGGKGGGKGGTPTTTAKPGGTTTTVKPSSTTEPAGGTTSSSPEVSVPGASTTVAATIGTVQLTPPTVATTAAPTTVA